MDTPLPLWTMDNNLYYMASYQMHEWSEKADVSKIYFVTFPDVSPI